MDREPQSVVCVCTDAALKDKNYYDRLWRAARSLNIPRRRWLDELADCFCAFRGQVRDSSGAPYEIPMIDEAFGDDMDCRWLSYYLKADKTGRKTGSKSSMYERLRLIDLYFRIRHPDFAKKFGA